MAVDFGSATDTLLDTDVWIDGLLVLVGFALALVVQAFVEDLLDVDRVPDEAYGAGSIVVGSHQIVLSSTRSRPGIASASPSSTSVPFSFDRERPPPEGA